MISKLSVLYDADCGFCLRCRDWLLLQPKFLDIEFIARDDKETRRRFPGICASEAELVVIDDQGGVYAGGAAFLMCLYALVNYRAWSLRLASPALLPLARQGFELVSSQRHRINDWLTLKDDRAVIGQLERAVGRGAPGCATVRADTA